MSRALLLLLVLALTVDQVQSCPRSCNCYQASEVHCTFRSLLSVPPGLPPHTRRINLGFNSISRIHDSSFAGLKKAELLMLHSNDLHQIPPAGFKDMASLQILKLSYNKLRELWSPQTFTGLTSLLRLYLDHNLLQFIHPRAFLQLPSLRLVRLQGNRLHQLHPEALCTVSLLNTYYFSTLRHLDLSNNSLSAIPGEVLETAPLLETLALHSNPWSCDCGMSWLLSWTVAHPGVMKCPGSPQCPTCAFPNSLQGQGLLEQPSLSCAAPLISSLGQETPLELPELPEIQPRESFKEPLGTASLSLSDQQGYSVDVSCNITHSSSSQDITSELSASHSSPLPLVLSLSLECYADRHSYEKLWRIMAYYSETAARLERELMLSKAPTLAYRYKQAAETEGYYHTGVKASVRATPQWLLQPAISIQLNRAKSNRKTVHLLFSTRVSARSDLTSQPSVSRPWVLISTNKTITALSALAGSKVELPCPILSSGNHKTEWVLPDGSKIISPYVSVNDKWKVLSSRLVLQKLEPSDAGLYYCVASSGKDVDILPLQLTVVEFAAPTTREIVRENGIIGQPISLPCNASGSPLPLTSWLLPDGNIVRRGSAASGGITIETNGSLSLPSPSLRDAGHYRCIAVNQYGSDMQSTQLELKPRQIPPLRTSFPKGPQSVAGRSTKIRAPLLRIDEGSGDEEEEEENPVRNRRPGLPYLNRHPNQRKRGPIRNRPISANERRNRVGTRHRVTTNRIDPKKWADLLAKIRQKTIAGNSSQTAEPTASGNEISVARVSAEEVEGSAVDDTRLLEEGLQPIYPVSTATKPQTNTKTVQSTVKSTLKEATTQTYTTTSYKTLEILTTIQPTDSTEMMQSTTNLATSTSEPVTSASATISNVFTTSNLLSTSTETVQKVVKETSHSRPQQSNLSPSPRPQNPWNTRRRIGQRRRFFNRTRGRPLTPPRPLPDPINQTSPATPDTSHTSTDRVKALLPTTTSPANHIRASVSASSDPSTVSSPIPPLSLSSLSPTLTHSTRATPLPTSHIVTTRTQVSPETRGFQTLTPSGKHADRAPSKHGDDTERNLFGLHRSFSDTTVASAAPLAKITTALSSILVGVHSTSLAGSSTSPTATDSGDALLAVSLISPVTTKAAVDATTAVFIPSSTVTNTSPNAIYRTPFSTTTTNTVSTTLISKILVTPSNTVTTSPTSTTTTTAYTTTELKPLHTSRPTHTTTTSTTTTTITTASPSTSTSAVTRERPSADPRPRPVPGTPGQSRHHDWRKPGLTNSIPDSQSSRTHSPHSLLPASPRVPVVRSRPRISDPHIRTESVPAESTAWLHCEAQGEPKPTITWTKVSTGAVMSVHSRAQRFEVLLNGTLIIQSVQLQDRGTYICSAHSFLGRDRLLTTLEVWTRPPRMQLPGYREVTTHQGGNVTVDCRAEGVPAPLLSWVLPDRSVLTSASPSNARVTMDTNGTLHLSAVLPTERGLYRCVASNSAGAASASVRVHVSSLPPVIHQPKEETLVLSAGMPVYAHCSARGAPTPTLRWKIPGGVYVRPSQFLHGNLFVLPNGTLHIRSTASKDTGIYECSASNAVGADRRTVRVEIGGRQTAGNGIFTGKTGFSSSAHKDKTPANLYPTNSLNPTKIAPSERPRTALLPSGPTHVSQQPTSSPKINAPVTTSPPLLISRTKLSSAVPANDAKLSPAVGNSRTAAVPQGVLPVYPFSKARIVSTSPSGATVQYGDFMQLHCNVTGHPPPNIIWRTPNRKLVDVHFSFDQRLKAHPNGTLSVLAVTEKDGGDYLCIARNKVADDYRLVRVSVATTPAKIQHKQPFNHMVSLGKPLKVDCLASGHPDPSVRWSLPDGTTVNSVLQGADKVVRSRRLTVFDNGTLLVPAVGLGEEGEYTCYAENQGGLDTMKVKVKVMASSPPTFKDNTSYQVVKVQLGTTAKLPCTPTGDPSPSVTWLSPMNRVIPRTSSTGFYTERVVVVSGGTLEVRLAQKIDTGNYTCRASNAAGTRSKMVSLEVEVPTVHRNTVSSPSNNNNVLYRPVTGISTQLGRSIVSVGISGASNVGFRADNVRINRNNFDVNSNVLGNRESVVPRANPRANNIEVIARKSENDANTQNTGGFSSTVTVNTGNSESRNGNSVATNKTRSHSLGQGVVLTVKQRVTKGQSIFLHCPAQGVPPPRLTWLLPGNGVLPAPYYGSRLTVHRNGTLELRSVRSTDSGTLVCVVRGDRGETRLQVELDVTDGPQHLPPNVQSTVRNQITQNPVPRAPSSLFIPPARAVTSTEKVVSSKTAPLVSIINGENLRVPCSAPQSPKYSQGTLTWTLPNGKKLNSNEKSGQYSVQADGTLTVQQASVYDRGTYSCRFSSYDPSTVFEVTVPVIVIAYPPRITTGPAPVTYTRPGVAVELRCLTIATPRATITWEMPDMSQLSAVGQARIYGNRYLSPQGSLVIQNPSSRDTGFYRCTAKNVIGADTKATYLHVI